jgi:hypothetical protein
MRLAAHVTVCTAVVILAAGNARSQETSGEPSGGQDAQQTDGGRAGMQSPGDTSHHSELKQYHEPASAPQAGADDTSEIFVVRETRDTVYVAKSSALPRAFKRSHEKVGVLREKGFGIGGGPNPGVHAIDMGPVRDLAERSDPLQDKHFHFGPLDYKPFRMRGGLGYVGFGNGLRIGGGGSGGRSELVSDFFSGDSALVLETKVSFGGFLVEKAFLSNRFNFNLGGYIGGGSLEVRVKAMDMGSATWFDLDGDGEESDKIEAEFMLLEAHGGFTYTIVPIFHIGVDLSMPAFLSPNGFSSPGVSYSSQFFTVNPGFKARVVFGNLG